MNNYTRRQENSAQLIIFNSSKPEFEDDSSLRNTLILWRIPTSANWREGGKKKQLKNPKKQTQKTNQQQNFGLQAAIRLRTFNKVLLTANTSLCTDHMRLTWKPNPKKAIYKTQEVQN